ncbi:MAG: hypothetical protein CFE50_07955 [Pseudomonas sp. PGPPP4]|nr:MAG: hypothetical protein CFE50_07955 [Pseudomonas sp. PGPPP4]
MTFSLRSWRQGAEVIQPAPVRTGAQAAQGFSALGARDQATGSAAICAQECDPPDGFRRSFPGCRGFRR